MSETLFYRCEKCGNIVALIKAGGGTLTCCDQKMTKLDANSTDAAQEKHVPVLVCEGAKLRATVGSVIHPMTPEHFIEWIALVTADKIEITYLKPGMEPEVDFLYYRGEKEILFAGKDDEIVPNCEGSPCNFVYGDKTQKKAVVYEYCNLHGLWKKEL